MNMLASVIRWRNIFWFILECASTMIFCLFWFMVMYCVLGILGGGAKLMPCTWWFSLLLGCLILMMLVFMLVRYVVACGFCMVMVRLIIFIFVNGLLRNLVMLDFFMFDWYGAWFIVLLFMIFLD